MVSCKRPANSNDVTTTTYETKPPSFLEHKTVGGCFLSCDLFAREIPVLHYYYYRYY